MEGKKLDNNAIARNAPPANLRHGAPQQSTAPQQHFTTAAPEIFNPAEISFIARRITAEKNPDSVPPCSGEKTFAPQQPPPAVYAAPITAVQPGVEISSHPKISTNLAIAEPQATRAPRTERVTARGARKIDNLFCRTTRVGAVARAGPHGGQGNPLARAVGCPTENELNIYSDSPTQKSHTTMTNATTPNTYARTARRVPLATSHHHPGSQHHHPVPPYHTINEPDNLRPSRNRSTPTLEKYASNTRTALTDTRVCVVRHTATTTQHHHPVPPHHHPVPPHHRPMPPHEKETHRSPPAPASNHALPAGHSASRWHGLASRDARVHDTRVQLGGRTRAFREATAHAAHARVQAAPLSPHRQRRS